MLDTKKVNISLVVLCKNVNAQRTIDDVRRRTKFNRKRSTEFLKSHKNLFLLYKRNVNVSVKIIVSYPINIIDIRSSFSYFWAPTPSYPPCLCYLLTRFALIRSSKYQLFYYQKRNRSFLWGFFGYHDNFDNVLVLTEKAIIF